MDNREHYQILIQRYLDGRATDEELEVFLHLIAKENVSPQLEEHAKDLYQSVFEENKTLSRHSTRRFVSYVAAAAIVVLVMAGWYLFEVRAPERSEHVEIAPGRNKASLILADGGEIVLSTEHTGIIIGDNVTYLDGSDIAIGGMKGTSLTTGIHTIVTPRGGTYQITLPDGSRVWLNASSTLKYPAAFDHEERVVELTGEAYFEITEGAHSSPSGKGPFKVITKGQIVEVLGTEFNVSAYPDENETVTTLVDGIVRISQDGSLFGAARRDDAAPQVILQPHEQAVLSNGVMTKASVKVDRFIAWKSGLFDFTGMTLPEVMRQLERWYDIEVIWREKTQQYRYMGQIYRDNDLSQILKILESAQVRFTIQEDRKLIIH